MIYSKRKSICGRAIIALGLVTVFSSPLVFSAPRNFLPEPGICEVHTLSQHWSDAVATEFYNTAQGSQLINYEWIKGLEQPESEVAFLDAAHNQDDAVTRI